MISKLREASRNRLRIQPKGTSAEVRGTASLVRPARLGLLPKGAELSLETWHYRMSDSCVELSSSSGQVRTFMEEPRAYSLRFFLLYLEARNRRSWGALSSRM